MLCGIGVALVVVTIGLFPTDCLVSEKIPAGNFERRREETCQTLSGIEWSSQLGGIAVVVAIDLLLRAVGLATYVGKKRRYRSDRAT